MVVVTDGRQLMTAASILDGRQVWRSTGGQQLGSIWGHGAYQAPDWSADWLHRESITLLDVWAESEGAADFAKLSDERQAVLRERLLREMRSNGYDTVSGVLTLSPERAEAIRRTAEHYDALYSGAPELDELREAYAMRTVTVPDAERRRVLMHFFFWTAWASTTERPDTQVTYTNNWPHEPLVGNRPTAANVIWTIVSVVLLLAAIGALVWWRAFRADPETTVAPPISDPLSDIVPTGSMRAVAKYLGVVVQLFIVQVVMGALTAHYTLEGQGSATRSGR